MRAFQRSGQRLQTQIQELLEASERVPEGQEGIVPLPRAEELTATLDCEKRALYIGQTKVNFRGSLPRFNVVKKLIMAEGPLPQYKLSHAPQLEESPPPEDFLPSEDSQLEVWISRIRDDIEDAAFKEVRRVVNTRGIADLPPETEEYLKQEAALLSSVIPKAQTCPEEERTNQGIGPLVYRWDFSVLDVNVLQERAEPSAIRQRLVSSVVMAYNVSEDGWLVYQKVFCGGSQSVGLSGAVD